MVISVSELVHNPSGKVKTTEVVISQRFLLHLLLDVNKEGEEGEGVVGVVDAWCAARRQLHTRHQSALGDY